jgi:hypothetical protein
MILSYIYIWGVKLFKFHFCFPQLKKEKLFNNPQYFLSSFLFPKWPWLLNYGWSYGSSMFHPQLWVLNGWCTCGCWVMEDYNKCVERCYTSISGLGYTHTLPPPPFIVYPPICLHKIKEGWVHHNLLCLQFCKMSMCPNCRNKYLIMVYNTTQGPCHDIFTLILLSFKFILHLRLFHLLRT